MCHFKNLQGWRLRYFPGQPVSRPDNPLCEEFFPIDQPEPSLAQIEVLSSCTVTCCIWEETSSHYGQPALRYIWRVTRSPLRLPFWRLNNLSFLSHSPQDSSSRPLASLVAFLWTCSNTLMSFLWWGTQNRTQHYRCSLTNATARILPPLLKGLMQIVQGASLGL